VSIPPLVTAVIVSHNSSALIDDCLAGLIGDPRVQALVVDSGSSDDTVDRAEAHPGVEVLAQGANLGWSACSNIGARAASAPAIAFVNPDTRATAEQLIRLTSDLGGKVSAVSPRFVDERGRDQYFYFRLPSPLTGPFLYLNSGQRIDEKVGRPIIRRHLYGERLPVDHAAHAGAACMVIDAPVFHRLGGFDERMWVFFSDMDFSRRLSLAGRELAVNWDVPVTHIGGGSVKALHLERLQTIMQRDYAAYSRAAFGPVGRALTVSAVLMFSGFVPALMALARREPSRARSCLKRSLSVLAR
jgi:N-acetylglucosaminyl-diphospho-decaprenol L-rhamnosyltransferase